MKLFLPLFLSIVLCLIGVESKGVEKFLFPPGFDTGKNLDRVKRDYSE